MWCRRTDELVDGPNASHITPTALDRWESRLDDLFQGRPFDMLDAALSDTVTKFPVDIQVRITAQRLYKVKRPKFFAFVFKDFVFACAIQILSFYLSSFETVS